MRTDIKDDRPPDSISFAASNLVKPGLSSRRQQSEPPVNRNMFPPTPPPENPENDGRAALPARGLSVRNGQKPVLAKLNINPQEQNRKYEKAMSPPDGRPRVGRSNSAAPGRQASQRDAQPAPLQRRPTRAIEEEDETYPDEVYDMYQAPGGPRTSRGSNRQQQQRQQQPRYADDDDVASDYDEGSIDSGEFEMLPPTRRPAASTTSGSSRAASRRAPEIRKIRVKVHAPGDVRYVMIGPAVEFSDLSDRIRDKFGIRKKLKIKIKDEDMPEGDMITMGDQDDLDMAISSARTNARKTRQEVGKIDVRSLPIDFTQMASYTDQTCRFGFLRFRGDTHMAQRSQFAHHDVTLIHATCIFIFILIFTSRLVGIHMTDGKHHQHNCLYTTPSLLLFLSHVFPQHIFTASTFI